MPDSPFVYLVVVSLGLFLLNLWWESRARPRPAPPLPPSELPPPPPQESPADTVPLQTGLLWRGQVQGLQVTVHQQQDADGDTYQTVILPTRLPPDYAVLYQREDKPQGPTHFYRGLLRRSYPHQLAIQLLKLAPEELAGLSALAWNRLELRDGQLEVDVYPVPPRPLADLTRPLAQFALHLEAILAP